MAAAKRVGLVGVGLMGHGIARNLLAKGHRLAFLTHPGNRPVDDLLDAGAQACADLGTLAREREVVVLCVTGSAQVESVLLGDGGLLGALEPGCVVIDCSTVEPQVTHRVAAAVAARGGRYLDAPMTRTPKEAEAGRLNLMVGGDAGLLEEMRPVLGAFAENIYHAGPVGAGHTLKLLHNFVSLGNCVLLAEAVACARRGGVDAATLVEVLASGGGDSVALKRLGPYILHGDKGGFLFSLANCRKDMGYYTAMADHLGVPSLGAHAVQQVFGLAAALGAGDRPVPALIDLLDGLRGS